MAAKKKRTDDRVVVAATRAAADLDASRVPFAVIGGLAVSAWGEPRYTRDVDLAIAVEDDREAELLVHRLGSAGYEVLKVIEQTKTSRLATARLRRRDEPEVIIDLLFASSGIEREVVAGAARLEADDGFDVPVASIGHLIALKVLSESEKRLQDRIDIQELAKVAGEDDWQTADAMVRLIKQRGFHRGRALVTRLRHWRRSTA